MVDESSEVDDELLGHKNAVQDYIAQVTKVPTRTNRQGVVDRFVRDCNLFIGDVDEKDVPTAADLVDFGHRRASLEIQLHNLTRTSNGG